MPLYSFQCAGCGHEFEHLMRLSDDAPACPSCGGGPVQRLLSATHGESKTKDVVRQARAQAAREGHFSNYKRTEIPRR